MRILAVALLLGIPALAQEPKIAIIGLVHSHVWGHIGKMIKGEPAKLVGITETVPDLIAEAKKRGAPDNIFFDDYNKMLEQTKPDIVWACVPRKINVIFEKPLASTYKDAVAIRDLAKKYDIRVMTNYQMAWWPANYA